MFSTEHIVFPTIISGAPRNGAPLVYQILVMHHYIVRHLYGWEGHVVLGARLVVAHHITVRHYYFRLSVTSY
jgi:hypothetical protein